MIISKKYFMKKILCAFGIILFFICLTFNCRDVYCGECLSSDEDMYNYVLEFYKKAIIGDENLQYGSIDLHCWRGDEDLNGKLKETFEKMISDARLHPVYIKEVAAIYIKMFGPTEFILDYFKRSQGLVRSAIIENLMYQNNISTFDVISFIKEQIQVVTDIELKRQLIETLASKKSINYREFIQFCQDNKIIPEDKVIYNFREVEALEFIFNARKLENEQAHYSDKGQMKHFHRYSKYIHNVLAYNLDQVFQKKHLDRMTLEDLRYLRNGILASYGKMFQSKLLQYYYYGEYPYVNQYCHNGKCGLGERKKGGYKSSDLTEIDKTNIVNIAKIEEHYKEIGYNESGLFIENYDIQAFLNNSSKRFTFSSPNLINLKQIKLNWENNEIWTWDKYGIVGWNLKTGKKNHFIEKGKGPISFSPKNRLLSYQQNNKLVLKNVDSNKIIYQQDLKKYKDRRLNERYSLFSKDEEYFIFSTYDDDYDKYADTITFSILQISSGKKREIKLPYIYKFYYLDMTNFVSPEPFIITEDNQYIIALILKEENTYFAVIPVASQENVYYKNSGLPNGVLSMVADQKNENIYLSLYYKSSTIFGYTIKNILNKEQSTTAPELIIDCVDSVFGYPNLLKCVDNYIFRDDGFNLAWINLAELRQLDAKQYNEKNIKVPKLEINKHKIITQKRMFREFSIQSFDISGNNKLIAACNEKGFIVIEHFPDSKENAAENITFNEEKQTMDIKIEKITETIRKDSKKEPYEKRDFNKIDFIDGSTEVYDKPEGNVFAKISDNSKVDILQRKGNWVEINYAKIKGWISKDSLLGENVNKQIDVGYTALSKVAFMGRLETVIFLISKGADANNSDKFGRNSLHWAIKGAFLLSNKDQIEIIKKIININGIDINKIDNDGMTPFSLAVMSQNLEIIKLLSNQKEIDINKADNNGESPIDRAIKYGNIEIVKYLLTSVNLNINQMDKNNQTPIYYSVLGNNIEITKLLLSRNAKVDVVNNNGETLLHAAFKCYPYSPLSPELIALLASIKGIDINRFDNNNNTPLLLAIESRNIDAVKTLLSIDDIDVNANSYQDGNIYLHRIIACLGALSESYNKKLAKLFLTHENIDVNMPDQYGRTLIYCDWNYYQSDEILEIINLILMKKPDVNIVDKNGETPLYYNADHNKAEIVKILLNIKGININKPNKNGYSPLKTAKMRGYSEIVKLLVEAGAKE